MALETGSYINDLTITNPLGSDAVSAGDDHIRLLKTVLKECFAGFTGAILITATESGTASAHVLTPSTALVGYTTGLMLLYRPTNAGTGVLTVNVSGLGAKNVKTILGADPTSGDIVANQPILLMYDGTNFVILAGSEILMRTGNQTMTGNLTMVGTQTVTGDMSVSGALTGASMTAKANKAGETYTGPHNFTGATITGPTQAAGTNTTDMATCAFVVAQAFSAILPGISAATTGKVLSNDGTNANWVNSGPQVSNQTTDYTILTTDLGKVITLTGATSRTFTTPAAATAAAGWHCYVHNNCDDTAAASNPVTMTIDGNAAETIDGVTTITEYKNGALLLMTDGSNWFTVRISGGFARFVQTGTFTWPTRLTGVLGDAFGGGAGGGKTTIGAGAGAGSGGGGGRRFMPIPLLAVNTATTVTVGAAGVGSTSAGNNGTSGGQSSFSILKAGGGSSGGGGGGIENSSSADGGLPSVLTGVGINLGTSTTYRGNIGYGGAGAGSNSVGGNAEFGGGGAGVAGAPNGFAGGSSINGAGGGGGAGGNGATATAGTGGAGGSNNSTAVGGGGAGGTTAPTAGTAGTSRDFAAGDGGGGGGSSGTAGAVGGAGGVPGGGGGAGGAGSVSVGNGGDGGRGEVRIWYR